MRSDYLCNKINENAYSNNKKLKGKKKEEHVKFYFSSFYNISYIGKTFYFIHNIKCF